MSQETGRVRYLTVEEVAAVMRVSKMTVYRLLHSGELPGVRVGRSFRVPQDALDAYLRSSSTVPLPEDRGEGRLSS
ncbi:MAG: helix-turn-helix domain-containing protein [Cellulomonas sp.]|jgi:excisionase family DNA binding protein|uniref:helix-turn-helix domain-containing protein n=1 Tax=Cellulomonas sp. 73-92 TaxID=1895740 RepID=UPI0009294393|nr:helix-turn-helix domain-containing protein [Cellulomonas sp. 73-92]MBN9374467.1 helix-turn-helix domain-containing protein [Cellulomonas sp.]OJV78566.1 MAG: excisionase [Cellulomonas sp. 73-92]